MAAGAAAELFSPASVIAVAAGSARSAVALTFSWRRVTSPDGRYRLGPAARSPGHQPSAGVMVS